MRNSHECALRCRGLIGGINPPEGEELFSFCSVEAEPSISREKLVEAVGIEPTPADFPLAGFVFIGVHYECIEVHISMLFN